MEVHRHLLQQEKTGHIMFGSFSRCAWQSSDKQNLMAHFMDNNIKTQGNPGYIANDIRMTKVIYNQAFTLKMFFQAVESSADDLIANGKRLLDLLESEYRLR